MEVAISDFFNIASELFSLVRDSHDDDKNISANALTNFDHAHAAQLLEHVISTLAEHVDAVGTETPFPKGDVLSIQRLARPCLKVARDLLIRISRVREDVVKSKAGLAYFCAAWPLDDVLALGQRLRQLRQQYIELSSPQFQDVSADVAARLGQLNIEASEIRDPTTTDGANVDNAAPVHAKPKKVGIQQLMGHAPIAQAPQTASSGLLQDFVLDSLSYKSMRDREEEVAEAHGSSFDWIFDQGGTSGTFRAQIGHEFTKWLSTDDLGSIFWINGKAGSGKSTLMRYLYESQFTVKYLKSWAEQFPLAKAGFFFWTSGSEEQRSQRGLLRYLLHQLLSSTPEKISTAFPGLWRKLQTMSTKERIQFTPPWDVSELMSGFHRLLDALLSESKVCLFIDGLDEFDGDHLEIINFFKNIAEGRHGKQIKMCLSSRPWAVFENAFEYQVPNLKLQDLTSNDMLGYLKDNLRKETRIRRLFKSDPEGVTNLTKEAIERADGVFLWTRLAVRQILKHFSPGQTIQDMQTFLRTLPTDLDELFDKLLFQDQSPAELSATGNIFQLIRAREIVANFLKDESSNALTIWEMTYAIHEDDNHTIISDVHQIDDKEAVQQYQTTKAQIMDRSAGLLEVYAKAKRGGGRQGARFLEIEDPAIIAQNLAEQKVTYLHRTVRDYLMLSPGVWDKLSTQPQTSQFDPHLRLLRSYILRLQNPLEEPERHRRLDEWWPDIALSMTHARYIHHDPLKLQHTLLNSLNNTLSWYWLPRSRHDQNDHWARNAFGSYESRGKAVFHEPFLCLATKFGLTQYIRSELDTGRLASSSRKPNPTPLLPFATEFLISRQKTIYPLSSPNLISLLLSHPLTPERPNEGYIDFNTKTEMTPWISVLRNLRTADRRRWIEYYDSNDQGVGRWCHVIRLFLEGGADKQALITKDNWDPEITAKGVIDMLFDKYAGYEIGRVRDMVYQ